MHSAANWEYSLGSNLGHFIQTQNSLHQLKVGVKGILSPDFTASNVQSHWLFCWKSDGFWWVYQFPAIQKDNLVNLGVNTLYPDLLKILLKHISPHDGVIIWHFQQWFRYFSAADLRGVVHSLKKARSPILASLVLGSTSKPWPPDLRVRVGSYMAKSSDPYSGANPFKAWNSMSRIIKSILYFKGSQGSGVMCSCHLTRGSGTRR